MKLTHSFSGCAILFLHGHDTVCATRPLGPFRVSEVFRRKELPMNGQIAGYLTRRGCKVERPDALSAKYGVEADGTLKELADDGCFIDWFGRTFLRVDDDEYRRAFWREVFTTGHTIGPLPRTWRSAVRELSGCPFYCNGLDVWLALFVVMGGIFPFWFLARLLSRRISRWRRPSYYVCERERRHRLSDARRAIRIRRTVNARPSLDDMRTALAHVRETAARTRASAGGALRQGDSHALAVLRLGALLEDLECYVDNHAYVTRGVPGVRGRAPGIKGLFAKEAPDLHGHYKFVMRCKSIAKKYRQACGCPDPVPADALLPLRVEEEDFTAERQGMKSHDLKTDGRNVNVGKMVFPDYVCLRDVSVLSDWMRGHGNTAYLKERGIHASMCFTARQLLGTSARKTAAEILLFGNGTLIALEAAIALKIDPACATEESDPHVRVKRLMGGRRAIRFPERVRRWFISRKGNLLKSGAA